MKPADERTIQRILEMKIASREQIDEAVEIRHRMSEMGLRPRSIPEILYEKGDTLERMGRPADAKAEFGRIYEFDIGFRDVGDRLRKLEGGESRSTLSLEN